jgi:anti-sigma regulatory factor (Ser/Thr protein kinase)
VPTRAFSSDTRDLRRLRDAVRKDLIRAGAADDVIDDAVLCVHEACMNSMQHGKGRLRIRWTFRHGEACFEICDEGEGLAMPLSDALPSADQLSGRGLFLISRLCDHFETKTSGATRCLAFTIRLDGTGAAAARSFEPAGFAAAN